MVLLRVLLLPLRLLSWPFRALGRGGATRRAAGGALAGAVPDAAAVRTAPHRAYTFLFREIGRPRLKMTAASDFDTKEAMRLAEEANAFYSAPFDLFPSGGLFYEEVERRELRGSLGSGEDAEFVAWADVVRRRLNDNARRLFLYYTPAVLVMALALGAALRGGMPEGGFEAPVLGPLSFVPLAWPSGVAAGLLALSLLYQWPYKFAQQRNLLGLDNTITSRFSQLNQNFQVAKRHALNVERDKRMPQADELKAEAGAWTIAYQWIALRLFLAERLVRNEMYQVNRNAKLYAAAGLFICLVLVGALAALGALVSIEPGWWEVGSGLAFAALAYGVVMAGAADGARRELEGNEWFRFGLIELDEAIKEHVGEDKIQILTFRDRNRFE